MSKHSKDESVCRSPAWTTNKQTHTVRNMQVDTIQKYINIYIIYE